MVVVILNQYLWMGVALVAKDILDNFPAIKGVRNAVSVVTLTLKSFLAGYTIKTIECFSH